MSEIFTKADDDFIKANYLTMTNKELSIILKKSERIIVKRAHSLGIWRPPVRIWTPEEDAFILLSHKNGKTLTETAKELNRDRKTTQDRANTLGIFSWRRKDKHDKSGYEVVSFMYHKPPILKHREIMSQIIGRELRPGEIVHHIDTDINNNQEDNLFLCDQSAHMKCHWSLRKCANEGESVEDLIKDGIIKFDRKQGLYFRTDGGIDK